MRDLLLIASCGAIGAVSRYGVGILSVRAFGNGFVYGTLAVNLLGCLALGALMHIVAMREVANHDLRIALGVGFLGAFTTFSTFGVETFHYLEKQRWDLATVNVAANVVLGLFCVWAGVTLARNVVGG